MGYLHVEIAVNQLSRKAGDPSGDVVAHERNASSTTLVVCDGIGHGIKAHIAAQMCVSRILELLRQGYSLRKAFGSLVTTMNEARGTDLPYAVFTVARILNDGVTSVLSYEMPAPVFVTSRYAQVLPQRTVAMDDVLIGEANCHLDSGEGIMIVTDGITQAGLGMGLPSGWTIEGVSQFANDCLGDRIPAAGLPGCVMNQARKLWKKGLGDDCTVVQAMCRPGKTVNILTGPPADPKQDREVVRRFMMMEGAKVVSGGTTAAIVARHLGRQLLMETDPQSTLAPPRYHIEGVDLVTEGAVTLNQVYNVMDEDSGRFDEESGVTQLHELLRSADRIHLLHGTAINPATRDISFLQKGVLTRQSILPLLTEKLEQAGKLVIVEKV